MNLRNKPLCEVLELTFFKREQLNLNVLRQLPTTRYVLERYFTEAADYELWHGNIPNRQLQIIRSLADELVYIWINMNVIPSSKNNVIKLVNELVVNEFMKGLKGVHESKRKGAWNKRYDSLKDKLEDGFDIKRKDKTRSDEISAFWGPETTDEEEELYKDNCVRNDDGRCPRQRWTGGVDTKWQREANNRLEKMERSERFARQRELRIASDRERLQDERPVYTPMAIDDFLQSEEPKFEEKENAEYLPEKTEAQNAKRRLKEADECPDTRFSTGSGRAKMAESTNDFPEVEVRRGEKTFNVSLMEILVVMISVFKVDARKAAPLLQYIANTAFGQKWTVIEEDESGATTAEPGETKKRKKKSFDQFTLPTRKTLSAWVKDFSYLNLKTIADAMINAQKEDRVVTYGCDDTVKAAGNNRLDIKTARITIIGDDRKKESFSTGFYENISHSGKDSARIVSHDIAKLGVLAGYSYEDMLAVINFFMSDRAGDSDTMLSELGIAQDKRLKCNAHILLAIDVAIDKVFKDTETVIGLSSLIGRGAEHVFNSSKNSIWFLGMIAICKLLSPSHAKESISLYKDYKKYLTDNVDTENEKVKASKFKGFQENRFGRIGEISEAITTHGDLIHSFFEEQVDENQNKLVLAVSAYITSEWFMLCSRVATFFYEKITLQLKEAIGIDEFKSHKKMTTTVEERPHNWFHMKVSLQNIIKELGEMVEDSATSEELTGEEMLKSRCAAQIKEAIQRQMSRVDFFEKESCDEKVSEVNKAPITNLGPESNFGSVDEDLKRSGNSTKLSTISEKHIIEKNKLHTKEQWITLSDEDKLEQWKWARSSSEVKEVKAKEKELQLFLESVNELASEKKKKKKLHHNQKLMKALEKCKQHGGPITLIDIDQLDVLNEDQVKSEVAYLKLTSGQNIRYKRKVGNKFVNFTVNELRSQIRDVIKLPSNIDTDVNTAIKNALLL